MRKVIQIVKWLQIAVGVSGIIFAAYLFHSNEFPLGCLAAILSIGGLRYDIENWNKTKIKTNE